MLLLAEKVPIFIDILKSINLVIMNFIALFYLNQVFYLFGSFFLQKVTYKEAKKNHCYAYMIPARNEEHVIKNLIESIKKQDYPQELMHIFVIADNCTDKTADIARTCNVEVFERTSTDQIGKSYALDFAFKKIFKEYSNLNIDAFIVFDADNLVDKNFTKEVNKTFDTGSRVITTYRAPKNFSDSWLAGGTSYMYLREGREAHRLRANIDSGTYISGTGFLVDSKLIKENNGWIHHTLVEDIEFSTDLASLNIKICYCEDAIFYDEQPITMKDSYRQRLRWCRGIHQVFGKYCGKLLKSMFRRFSCAKWDMFVHTSPMPAITTIWIVLFGLIGSIYCFIDGMSFSETYNVILKAALTDFFAPLSVGLFNGIVIMIQTWKTVIAPWYKKILYGLLFPVFMFTFIPITIIALFKNVAWSEVKHTSTLTIDDLQAKKSKKKNK